MNKIGMIGLILCVLLPIITSNNIENNFESLENTENNTNVEDFLIFKKKCEKPSCKIFRRSKLYPHKDPYKYWQCKKMGLISYVAHEIECQENGFKFDYKKQKCVDPEQESWKSVCKGDTITTPDPTTEVTTEMTTTSEETSSSSESSTSTEASSTETSTEVSTTIESTITEPTFTTEEGTISSTESTSTKPIPTTEVSSTESTMTSSSSTETSTESISSTTEEMTSSTAESSSTETLPTSETTETSSTGSTLPETSTDIPTTTTASPLPTAIPMPDPVDCDSLPTCSFSDLFTLFPMRDPTRFYKCELLITETGGSWKPIQNDCPIAINGIKQYFSFLHQTCLDPRFWSDVCIPDVPSCTIPTCFNENQKYPDRNPRDFFECVNDIEGNLHARKQTCSKSLFFGYDQQTCVNVTEWQDPCRQVLVENIQK